MFFKFTHGGNVGKFREQFGRKSIIDFSANINPLGPSLKALGAVRRYAAGSESASNPLVHYPDTDCKCLRRELAQHIGAGAENIIAGNGSIEIIYLIARVLRPKKAAILTPAFSEYKLALNCAAIPAAGIKFIKRTDKNNFAFPHKEVLKAIDGIDLIFLCNPNNPTGDLIPKEHIIELIETAHKKKKFIILDETFIDFCPGQSVLKRAPGNKYLIVLRSFSKLWGLPGLRLGYAVSHCGTIETLKKYKEPWTVNVFSQIAGIESLRDKEHLGRSVRFIKNESDFLFKRISAIRGLKPYPPSANYIFLKITAGMSSGELYSMCGRKGVIIRDCSNFYGLNNKFIRVAVRTRNENLKLLKALEESING
jgi:threonine-phosphate decarboxylase